MKIKVSSCFLDDPVTKKKISTKALVYKIGNAHLYGCVHSTVWLCSPEWFYRPDGDHTHVYDLEQIPDLSSLTDEEEFQLLTVWDYGLKYEDVKKIQEHFYSTDILTCSIKDFRGSLYEIQI